MTRKHFTFAAEQIITQCYYNGIKKEQSILYERYVEFFKEFSDTFNQSTFDTYIDKQLNNYK